MNERKEKKYDSLSSADPNLSYEDYLAKQQNKFKKLYGKKLIVEDDYLKEAEQFVKAHKM